MSLYIYAEDDILDEVRQRLAAHRWTDSGFDIPYEKLSVDRDESVSYIFKLKIHVAATDDAGNPVPCLLLPRSSISNTPFRLMNSIGLLDAGYRGEVQARCDVIAGKTIFETQKGFRYFQIVRHDFLPWKNIVLVNSLKELPSPPDSRGSGGFGSTN